VPEKLFFVNGDRQPTPTPPIDVDNPGRDAVSWRFMPVLNRLVVGLTAKQKDHRGKPQIAA
tara:strand:+ start:1001 stop:1183 length:183 start_codon:yes stop_codon:yes gene_type:complete